MHFEREHPLPPGSIPTTLWWSWSSGVGATLQTALGGCVGATGVQSRQHLQSNFCNPLLLLLLLEIQHSESKIWSDDRIFSANYVCSVGQYTSAKLHKQTIQRMCSRSKISGHWMTSTVNVTVSLLASGAIGNPLISLDLIRCMQGVPPHGAVTGN